MAPLAPASGRFANSPASSDAATPAAPWLRSTFAAWALNLLKWSRDSPMKSAPCAEQPTTTSSAVRFRSGANAASKDSTFCADCTEGGTRNGGGARGPRSFVGAGAGWLGSSTTANVAPPLCIMAGYLGLWLTGGGGGDATTSGKAASVCGAAIAGAAALAASSLDPGLAGSPPATSGDGAGRLGLFFFPVFADGRREGVDDVGCFAAAVSLRPPQRARRGTGVPRGKRSL